MGATCFRCGRDALATLNIVATIGTTQLKVSEHAEQPAVCAARVLELAAWFRIGDNAEIEQAAAALGLPLPVVKLGGCGGGSCVTGRTRP